MKLSLDEFKLAVTDRYEQDGQSWPYSMPRQDHFLEAAWNRGLNVSQTVRLVEDYVDGNRRRQPSPSIRAFLYA